MKSPSFVRLIESGIENRFQRQIKIGSLSFAETHGVIMQDLTLFEKGGGNPFMTLPYVEIDVSLKGLLNKSLDAVVIKGPKLFMDLRKEKGDHETKRTKPEITLPFALKKGSLQGGEVILRLAKDKEIKGTLSLRAEIVRVKEGMDVRIKGDLQDLRVHGGSGSFSFKKAAGDVSARFTVTGASAGNPVHTGKISWRSDLRIADLFISRQNLNVNLRGKPVRLFSEGAYYPGDDRLTLKFLSVQLEPWQPWSLAGSLTNISSADPEMDLHFETQGVALSALKQFLTGPGTEWLNPLRIKGKARVDVSLKGSLNSPRVQGLLDIHGESLKREWMELKPFKIRLPFEYSKHGTLIREAGIKGGTATVDLNKEKGITVRLRNAALVIPRFTIKASRIRSPGLLLQADRGVIYRSGERYYTEKGISLRGGVEADLEKGEWRLKHAVWNTSSLKKVSADLSLKGKENKVLTAAVTCPDLDIGTLWARLPRRPSVLERYSVKGRGTFRSFIRMTFPEGSPGRVTGRAALSLIDGGFSSVEADQVAEGIVMKVRSAFKFSLPVQEAEFTVDAEATDFELLLGSFYGDFTDRKLSLSAAAAYKMDTDVLNVSRADLNLEDIGALHISGMVSNIPKVPFFHIDEGRITLSNKAAYDFFVRETFQESYPFLSHLELDGLTRARFSTQGSRGAYHLRGEIRFQDLSIRSEQQRLNLTGVQMNLPVDLSYPVVSHTEGTGPFGFLRVRKLSWRELEIGNLEVFPALWRNSLTLKNDVTLPVFGGDVRLKEIAYKDILSPERRMRMSIEIDAVDLSELSVALGLPRFNGSLSGTVPKINFTGSRLLTEGEIILNFFGGEVKVREMSAENLFSPIVSLHSTVELKEMDLSSLTDTFRFGHVSGILQGFIKDLVITNGQAESFSALVETVKRKHVSQKIGVKALEKITILGSGTSPSIFGRGIYQLFKEYRYSKMGFKCRLKNDTFELYGIAREGDREYLVKGGLLPPKVNVINFTRKISFREMVKRLKRIQRAGKGAEGKGE